MLATYFVYIPSHSGITAIFSAAALQSKKGPRPKENITVCFFLLFCRCCYSCKQKSRHPIIPVGERERERQDPRQPAPSPPPLQKKETEFGKDIIYQKHGLFVRAHHYLHLQSYTLADVRYSRNFTLFRNSFLSFSSSFCLSALPCHPQFETLPLKTLSGLAFLVCLSYLYDLVSFSPPGRTTTLFHSLSRYRHQFIAKPDRIVVVLLSAPS